MSSSPCVTAIMPMYNAERFLTEAIESVLAQSLEDFELLIFDDGSEDRSLEIARSYDDKRVVVRSCPHKGGSQVRNEALALARAKLIVWCDADDLFLPARFELLHQALDDTGLPFAHSDLVTIDENGAPLRYFQSQQISHRRLLRAIASKGSPYANGTIMFRKELFAVPFDPRFEKGADTLNVWQNCAEITGVHIPLPLYLYRQHGSNTSKDKQNKPTLWHILDEVESTDIFDEVAKLGLGKEASLAISDAILGLLLFRRGYSEQCNALFAKHTSESDPIAQSIIIILRSIVEGNAERAVALAQTSTPNHIVRNYHGEALAILGRYGEAWQHFLAAIKLYPQYEEAMMNLGSVARFRNLESLDSRLDRVAQMDALRKRG